MEWAIIEIYTSQMAQYRGSPVFHAVLQFVRGHRIAARTHVYTGIAAGYETGELATVNLVDVSGNLPVKIEILLPAAEVEGLLPQLRELVTEGAIAVRKTDMVHLQSGGTLLPRNLRVADIMSDQPVVVQPEAPALDAVRILMTATFRGLPVVNEARRVVGVVTEEDLVTRGGLPVRPGVLGQLGQRLDVADPALATIGAMRVSDIMTAPADTVRATATIAEAVRLMTANGRRMLPVVDATERLMGTCSRIDIIMAIGHWHRSTSSRKLPDALSTVTHTAGDLAVGKERSVTESATLLEAGRLLTESDQRRTAVVDENDRLIGVVAEADLIRALYPNRAGLLAHLLGRLTGRADQSDLSRMAATLKVTEAMTPSPVMARETMPLGEVASLMAEHHLKEVPAVDEQGRFLGFLSRRAIMTAILKHDSR